MEPEPYPSEEDLDRQYAHVQSLLPPPLQVPEDEIPPVLVPFIFTEEGV